MANDILGWVSHLVNQVLNPKYKVLFPLTDDDLNQIISDIPAEKFRIQEYFRSYPLLTNNKIEVQTILTRYNNEIVSLINELEFLIEETDLSNKLLLEVKNEVTTLLEDLYTWFQKRYVNSLSQDELVAFKEIEFRAEQINERLGEFVKNVNTGQSPIPGQQLLIDVINGFLSNSLFDKVAFKSDIEYYNSLANFLPAKIDVHDRIDILSTLERFFITWNLNSDDIIQYLLEKIDNVYATNTTDFQRLESFFSLYRAIYAIVEKPFHGCSHKRLRLKKILEDYIQNYIKTIEIIFQTKSILLDSNSGISKSPNSVKVTVSLTVDQIGILLRSLKKIGFFVNISLNALYYKVIPNIMTEKKDNISIESVQSKAYSAEVNDIQAVISFLFKLIKVIKELYKID